MHVGVASIQQPVTVCVCLEADSSVVVHMCVVCLSLLRFACVRKVTAGCVVRIGIDVCGARCVSTHVGGGFILSALHVCVTTVGGSYCCLHSCCVLSSSIFLHLPSQAVPAAVGLGFAAYV